MTPDIKRVLVPLDFSAGSARALDFAHAMAQRFGASLHLLHVCDVPAPAIGSIEMYAVAYTEWSELLGEEAAKQLTRAQHGIIDVPVSTEVLFGNPARCIVTAATTERADLIVMGTHGYGPVMHVLMGNVAERVVRTAPCAVLTVRQRREDERESVTQATATKGRATLCAVGAFVLAMLLPAPLMAQVAAPLQQTIPGGELFRSYCASCHGTAARGDGPLASAMSRKPADLTEIAKRNGGLFPSELVFRTIDGKRPVRGHGGADMPVWGDAFARSRDGGDPATVKRMIDSLVDYLESIQLRAVHQ